MESLVLDDIERTSQNIHALRQMGVTFSMDDFDRLQAQHGRDLALSRPIEHQEVTR